MSNESLTEWLGKTPLFAGLKHEHLVALGGIAELKNLFRQGLIFSEGDPGNGFYILRDGKVKIFKLSPEGKEQILHVFGPGEPFGEVPVFAGSNFPANAVCLEKSSLVFFPRSAFVDLITVNPALALNMLAVMGRRLRQFTEMIDALSLKEVPGRLATHLLLLSKKPGQEKDFELELSKTQLAALLGTIPETLSRVLGRLRQEKLIRLEGSRIIIVDRDGLEELAEQGRFL